MSRIALALALVSVTVCADAATAGPARDLEGSGSSLQLRGGRGTAVINSGAGSGSALGAVARGKIIVLDPPRGEKTKVSLSGCEQLTRPSRRKTVCKGDQLGFSIVGGIWRVTLQGRGIEASAVATGWVRLQGTRGTYSINGSRPKPWPRRARTFRLR
jgi:hypothetical protein